MDLIQKEKTQFKILSKINNINPTNPPFIINIRYLQETNKFEEIPKILLSTNKKIYINEAETTSCIGTFYFNPPIISGLHFFKHITIINNCITYEIFK